MAQQHERPSAGEPGEQPARPDAQADDAHTPFDDELELWIIASPT
jgi:hypothetical protein